MKASHRPAPLFVIRAPLLEFDTLSAGMNLRERLADPIVREAVFAASPELDTQLAEATDKLDPAVERALVRYLSRMAGRATPFGLFSGVVVGELGAATHLELGPRAQHRRHTRLDNDYLFQLCAELGRDPALRRELRYSPNTSLYRLAGRYRYAEARVGATTGRTYHLVAVVSTEYLDAVLARAESGATLDELAAVLAADPEISVEEAHAYLSELLDSQLLVSDLQPAVTGSEPSQSLVELLGSTTAGAAAAGILSDVNRQLAALDAAPLGSSIGSYHSVARTLEALPVKVELPRLFQVDLHLAGRMTLGPKVVDEIARGGELLESLTQPYEDNWAKFREAFNARYETREVPLVEVLDEEAGIGFGGSGAGFAPLLDGLGIGGRGEPSRVRWGPRENHLLALHGRAIASGAVEIELADADLEVLRRTTPARLADSFMLDATLIAESATAVDEGRFQLRIDMFTNASATRLLGRFCHGSPEITDAVAKLAAVEASLHPDVVFAEIVHLPEGRIGNILLRPCIREYEIPFVGLGGVDRDHQIPITDLLVSVVGNRVMLRSRRLGKEVRPQLATAHNYARGLMLYRFLCEFATQHTDGGGWSWGPLLDAPFLPRVRRNRIIVSRARWNLRRDDLELLDKAAKAGKPAKLAAIEALRDRRRLPRWIVVADGDNELPVDLDDPVGCDSFIQLVKSRQGTALLELFPGPDALCVRGPDGAFVHELFVSFVRTEPPASPPKVAAPPQPGQKIDRRFSPGSEWLYAKLYGGTANVEIVLREAIAPVVESVLADGLASHWFFIRYDENGHHLRVRFFGDPARLTGELLPRLTAATKPALEAGLLWRVQLDTYEREVERYGGDHGIELAEQLFAFDSDAVLQILDATVGDEGANARWKIALRGIDRLMIDLGLAVADRLALMTRLRDSYGASHGMDAAMQRRLGDKFRTHRTELTDLLDAPGGDDSHPYAPAIAALARRSERSAPIIARLHAAREAGRIASPILDLAGSYIHMHVNRLMATMPNQHELVLYDLLRRHYDGIVARARKK